MGLVDIHLHLLPGVDDGPATLAQSIVQAERMARDGVTDAVVTPHLGHPDFPLVRAAEIGPRTRALARALAAAGIGLRLRPGAEIHADAVDGLSDAELQLVAQGPPGARWVLLEAPFEGAGERFRASCEHLLRGGFGVVVAHPERSRGFHRSALPAAVVLQVNVCSLLGRHGVEARTRAEQLMLDGSAYVLASDAHGGTRAHTLRHGREAAIAAGVSSLRAAQLTAANPRFLFEHGLPARSPSDPPLHHRAAARDAKLGDRLDRAGALGDRGR
jgi:protein-tyrosine phosphatase